MVKNGLINDNGIRENKGEKAAGSHNVNPAKINPEIRMLQFHVFRIPTSELRHFKTEEHGYMFLKPEMDFQKSERFVRAPFIIPN